VTFEVRLDIAGRLPARSALRQRLVGVRRQPRVVSRQADRFRGPAGAFTFEWCAMSRRSNVAAC